MKNARGIAVCILVLVLALPPAPSYACGPFFPDAIFTLASHPDWPMGDYAAGKLGVLQPTYARAYLFVAYRHLSGNPLSAQERQAWLGPEAASNAPGTPPNAPPKDWVEVWKEKRKSVLGANVEEGVRGLWSDGLGIHRWRLHGEFIGYYNCLEDSFRNAADVLDRYVSTYSAQGAETRGWLAAQDLVFAHCGDPQALGGGKRQTAPYPEELSAGAPAPARADRAYQIAAAYFYEGEFSEALKHFEEISRDTTSPWHKLAPYLAARCLLRQGTLVKEGKVNQATLEQAEARLERILEDSSEAELHASARRLLSYVRLRLHPRERLHELSRRLAASDADLKQDLFDYTFLLDRFTGGGPFFAYEPEKSQKERTTFFENTADIRKSDDLTDWILTFQGDGAEASRHAYERWRETGSAAWLVAALAKAHADQAGIEPLVVAADKLAPDSPASPTASFHRLRLLVMAGKKEQARTQITEYLRAHGKGLPRSALNLFLALRLTLARNLDEFLADAVRTPAAISYGDTELMADAWNQSAMKEKAAWQGGLLDADAAQVLNRRLPLSELTRAAKSRALPLRIRRQIALAAWVRAGLLEDEQTGQPMATLLATLAPEMRTELDAYSGAQTREGHTFAAVFTMLRFPGAQLHIPVGVGRELPLGKMDHFRDNWWCDLSQPETPSLPWRADVAVHPHQPLAMLYANGTIDAPQFLTKAEKAEAAKEWQRLSAIPGGPNYLGAAVLEWARKHPEDTRVPEALHLVVRATRYGCTDKESGKFSKAAFELLHRRYPNSEWAKRTKFWFN